MFQFLEPCLLAEAIIYFSRRATGNTAAREYEAAVQRLPEKRDALQALLAPVLALEAHLDQTLHPDEALMQKYFSPLGDLEKHDPFGFNLGAVLLYFPVVKGLDLPMDAVFERMRQATPEERLYSVTFSLISAGETLEPEECSEQAFIQRVCALPADYESKFLIASIPFQYESMLQELYDFLAPAVTAMQKCGKIVEPVLAQFQQQYAGSADPAVQLSGCLDYQLEDDMLHRVHPCLFGFSRCCGISETDDEDEKDLEPPVDSMLLGICRHLLHQKAQSTPTALAERFKALSDSTRLEILLTICRKSAYGPELCEKFGLQRPGLSYHVTKLISAGFITAKMTAGRALYSADRESIQAFLADFSAQARIE